MAGGGLPRDARGPTIIAMSRRGIKKQDSLGSPHRGINQTRAARWRIVSTLVSVPTKVLERLAVRYAVTQCEVLERFSPKALLVGCCGVN